ncbi:MAG: Stp1/IreP family PP2C-type Ser/Thr phosphatase [Phycisphaerae bacterium]|nr:Stp1/IreP family PP2C-type Ser/Thr phosphatase [Phycisphaerae bacterium]
MMEPGETPIQLDPQVYGNLPFTWAVSSDIGQVRQINEDAYLVEPETGLFIVSDGMGGHAGGEVASAFVVSDLSVSIDMGFHKLRSKSPRAVQKLIQRAIRQHNKQVLAEAENESGYKNMGATLILALIYDGRATIANLGDSRLYRFRNGKLTQLSRDHSVVGELIAQGKLAPEQAENHPAEGVITQYMGMETHADPHVKSFRLKKNDLLLLCTDGLTDMLTDSQIRDILRRQPDVNTATQTLVEQANNAGGADNITVVLIDCH